MSQRVHTPYIQQQSNITRMVLLVPTTNGRHKQVLGALVKDGWTIRKATHPVQSKRDSLLAYDTDLVTIVAERKYVSKVLYVKKAKPVERCREERYEYFE